MAAKRSRRIPRVGDRVRDKTNGRVGTVEQVKEDDVRTGECTLTYDEGPQDRHITATATHGVRRPKACLEPER